MDLGTVWVLVLGFLAVLYFGNMMKKDREHKDRLKRRD